MVLPHKEAHRTGQIGWLRAAVLGANDGVVSVASLVVGVAASGAPRADILLAGVAGLVAGAMSMAAGEYVSVQSQADTEGADLVRERRELAEDPEGELAELAGIYRERGLDDELALRVAEQLTAHDALGAHARDELGITEALRARPVQAALASAAAFAVGAALPVAAAVAAPAAVASVAVAGVTLATLAVLGGLAGRVGGASVVRGAVRVAFWGALAMAITAGVGALVGTSL
ncbi:MAG TPA: VIT family protein [Rubricoccaceae bacterium]|jgi:VIT1/CCC1 family predicted Fe2+/Mn2+ transporter